MVTKDGFAKILDFGLAKLASSGSKEDQETETRSGTILGTVVYMSPEQAPGKTIDFRSDQFSFGSILYEMITGKRPFARRSTAETLSAIINDDPDPLTSLNPQTPAPIDWITRRCMAKDPQDRYESTRDLARDVQTLRDHYSGTGTSAERVIAPPEAARSRKLLPFVAASLLIVFTTLAFFAGKIMERRHTSPLGTQKAETIAPFSLRQLTFRRGFVGHARFVSDGQTIIYDAGWSGNRYEIFFTQIGNPESRSFGMKGTQFQAVSPKGDMAILLTDRIGVAATLAQVSFSGGAPRELSENVTNADWSPNGKDLAIIRNNKLLESPIGKRLYESSWHIGKPRFSPKGNMIAFIEMRVPGIGTVCLVDLAGKVRRLYECDMSRTGYPGLAWTPSGEEVWFTARAKNGTGWTINAVNLSGQKREILPMDGVIQLLDISTDGRILLAHGTLKSGITYSSAENKKERDISWLDGSEIADISDDGSTILFTENGAAGKFERSVYLRRINEPEAVRLGDGFAEGLSPDGKWALSWLNHSLVLLPTGPGQSRTITSSKLDGWGEGHWFPDGKRVLFQAYAKNRVGKMFYVLDIDHDKSRAISAEGIEISYHQNPISPDGKWIIAYSDQIGYFLYSIDDGSRKTIPSMEKDDSPIRWGNDGRSIYVDAGTAIPSTRIYRIDLAKGGRELWKEIIPSDPAGIHATYVMLTPDGTTYAYTYTRTLTDLYLIEGLK